MLSSSWKSRRDSPVTSAESRFVASMPPFRLEFECDESFSARISKIPTLQQTQTWRALTC